MQKILALILIVFFTINPLKAQEETSTTVNQTQIQKIRFPKNLFPLKFCIYPSFSRFKGEEQFMNWSAKDPGIKFCVFPVKPHFVGFYANLLGEFYTEKNYEHPGPPTFFKDKYLLLEGGPVITGHLPLKWGILLEGEVTWNIFTTDLTYPEVETALSWENKKETLSFGFGNIAKPEESIFNLHVFAGYYFHSKTKNQKKHH